MNKHAIILPLLVTSAISLHVLSFYVEEPDMTQNPEVIVDASGVPSPEPSTEVSSEPSEQPSTTTENPSASPSAEVPSNGTVKPSDAKASKVPVANTSTNPSSKPSANTKPTEKPSAAPTAAAPTPPPPPVPTPTPTPSPETIKVAGNFIMVKPYSEIIREAKMSGGRVDPFLSVKPPEIRPVPTPMPTPSIEVKEVEVPVTAGNKLPNSAINEVPPPKRTWVPNNDKGMGKGRDKDKKLNDKTIAQLPKNTNKNNPKIEEPTSPSTTSGEGTINLDDKMLKGLSITGIITGNKPLALVKDGDESKVVGVGDVIRESSDFGEIKVISINFQKNTVKVSNGKKSAILEVKEKEE